MKCLLYTRERVVTKFIQVCFGCTDLLCSVHPKHPCCALHIEQQLLQCLQVSYALRVCSYAIFSSHTISAWACNGLTSTAMILLAQHDWHLITTTSALDHCAKHQLLFLTETVMPVPLLSWPNMHPYRKKGMAIASLANKGLSFNVAIPGSAEEFVHINEKMILKDLQLF